MSLRRAFALLALSAANASLISLGCAPAPLPVAAPHSAAAAPLPPAPPLPPPPDPARFHALLVNGGGSPNINYQPHLAALGSLREVLLQAGLPPRQIDVLSSDGDDPAPDLTILATETPEDRWLLDGTRLERSLGSPLQLVSSVLPGASLGPATKAGLTAWFEGRGRALRAGDTLLLFVTDHGTKGPAGPETNAITLWGPDQSITVTELSALLAKLAPGVRVVSLMSQCFSGGFAGLSANNHSGAPGPTVCGYFSSTADRPAYGCFPENVGDDTVGHAHDFARALAATHSMPQAHAAVVRLDVTPDVPLRTSDLELERLVRAAASRDATPLWTTVARLLGPDWRQQPALRAEVAELDALATSFGLPVPLDLDALTPLDARLSTLERETATSAKVWRGAFGDATNGNLQAFLTANPTWSPKVADTAIPSLTPPLRAALGGALVSELLGFLKTRPNERLETLHARTSASSDTAYRMAVRRAVLLRVESRLAAMAGRALLASGGAESERAAYETLLACEDVILPGTPRPAAEGPPSAARSPLPSLEADEAAHRAGRPAWIGIAFNDTPASARRRLGLPDGSATVSAITPGSPANQAGLQVGDILHGADGQPFAERRGIRTWTLLQPAETPGRLDVLRGEQKLTLTIVPKALPEGVSPPPPPPSLSVGATAPPFQLRSYRGTIAAGKPHLYYFWATWCKPCKAAVPELLAYERATKTQIVAITDEEPDVLDGFFKTFKQPFPKAVAIDELRRAFGVFGASGTPTFVLLDGKGVVRSRKVGYSRGTGIVDGWKWDGK
jgi:thiol-disulfide isomerase/thioredoxin